MTTATAAAATAEAELPQTPPAATAPATPPPAPPAAPAATDGGGDGPDAPKATLWQHPDFLRLWSGQSLAMLGAQVGRVALPIVAVVLLDANAAQMGVLSALSQAPMLLFLFAGVWADRVRRRNAMIGTDLARFVLFGAIPVLYLADALTMTWLLVIAFVVGVLGVMFEVAYQAYLPSLVGREFLGEGNQKLQLSNSVAQVAGPSAAGLLVSAVASAMVIVASAFTYLASAVSLLLIRRPEPAPERAATQQRIGSAIAEGLRWVLAHRVLRPIVLGVTLFMFFNTALQTLYVLYLIDDLGVPVGWVGLIYAAAGPGAILGSWAALKIMKKYGLGKAILWSIVVCNGSLLLVPLAGGPLWLAISMLALSQFVFGLAGQIGIVNQTTLRMVLTPDRLQGRVAASFRAISLAMAPVGALLAGVLGQSVGVRPMVLVAAIGVLLPIVAIVLSPIPGIAKFPTDEQAAEWAPKEKAVPAAKEES